MYRHENLEAQKLTNIPGSDFATQPTTSASASSAVKARGAGIAPAHASANKPLHLQLAYIFTVFFI